MADIFIVSQHRTGSTLLKNMLDANPSVGMAFDEMNLFEPMRANTLDRVIGKQAQTADQLIDAIDNRIVYGTFWSDFENSGIDKKALKQALTREKELTPEAVLKVMLELLRKHNRVEHSGIKYPVHFSMLAWLIECFPQSKIIFLTRNPKAIVASKLNDPATRERKNRSLFHRFAVHYFTLLYFCVEFRKSVRVLQENRGRVYKVRYEDLVTDQSATLERLCRYLDIDFSGKMLEVSGKGSSYSEGPLERPTAVSVDKYKSVLSAFDKWLVGLLTQGSYSILLQI